MYRRILIARCVAGLLVGLSPAGHRATAEEGPEGASAAIELTGIVCDFRVRTVDGGRPDFEQAPDNGFGLDVGNVSLELPTVSVMHD